RVLAMRTYLFFLAIPVAVPRMVEGAARGRQSVPGGLDPRERPARPRHRDSKVGGCSSSEPPRPARRPHPRVRTRRGMTIEFLHPTGRARLSPRRARQPRHEAWCARYAAAVSGSRTASTAASPQNLERLRRRSLGAKRSFASREFALGVEALQRFVRGEPL